jgi:hypothetical protein
MLDIQRSHHFSAIHVLELLDPEDLDRTGTALYRQVIEPLATEASIYHRLHVLGNNSDLLPAIAEIEARSVRHKASPIIHFETHGSTSGLGRRSDPLVTYADLQSPLSRINQVSRGNLLITMAACFGGSVVSVFTHAERMPVWALLGPAEQTLPSDVERGFQAFYSAILKSFNLNAALDALRAADQTLPEGWYFQPAETLFAIGYGLHRDRLLQRTSLKKWTRALHKKAKRSDRKAGRARPKLREAIRASLINPDPAFYASFKERFFMADLFPENRDRFSISEDECTELYEIWKVNPNTGAA